MPGGAPVDARPEPPSRRDARPPGLASPSAGRLRRGDRSGLGGFGRAYGGGDGFSLQQPRQLAHHGVPVVRILHRELAVPADRIEVEEDLPFTVSEEELCREPWATGLGAEAPRHQVPLAAAREVPAQQRGFELERFHARARSGHSSLQCASEVAKEDRAVRARLPHQAATNEGGEGRALGLRLELDAEPRDLPAGLVRRQPADASRILRGHGLELEHESAWFDRRWFVFDRATRESGGEEQRSGAPHQRVAIPFKTATRDARRASHLRVHNASQQSPRCRQ